MAKANEKHQCCAVMRKGSGYHRYNVACENSGKVERDGHWYCGTHDPEAIAEKNRARTAARKAKWDEYDAARQREDRQRKATVRILSLSGQVYKALLKELPERQMDELITEFQAALVAANACGLNTEVSK